MFNFKMFKSDVNAALEARIADLESRLKLAHGGIEKTEARNADLTEHNKRQLDLITQLSGTMEVKALTRLKFSCLMPHGAVRESEFTLGLGRCGKTVESLELKRTDEHFVITQWHSDGSKKVFTYNDRDIIGRVQECYEVITVQPNTKYIERLREQAAFERRHRLMGMGRR